MRTERMTILVEPDYKANVVRRAALRGVSTSEHVRNALDSFDSVSSQEEAELAALVAEVNKAIPEMRASLDRSCERLEATHKKVDALLRESGFRQ